jgi:hypothetical protein
MDGCKEACLQRHAVLWFLSCTDMMHAVERGNTSTMAAWALSMYPIGREFALAGGEFLSSPRRSLRSIGIGGSQALTWHLHYYIGLIRSSGNIRVMRLNFPTFTSYRELYTFFFFILEVVYACESRNHHRWSGAWRNLPYLYMFESLHDSCYFGTFAEIKLKYICTDLRLCSMRNSKRSATKSTTT